MCQTSVLLNKAQPQHSDFKGELKTKGAEVKEREPGREGGSTDESRVPIYKI